MRNRSLRTQALLLALFLGLLVLALAGWVVQGMRFTLALPR